MAIDFEIDIEALREENNLLKQELKKYKPELKVSYNLETECLECVIFQDGHTITTQVLKDEFKHYSNNELIDLYVDELLGIQKTILSYQLANQLLPLVENLKKKNLL
jgi:hypothetical protein